MELLQTFISTNTIALAAFIIIAIFLIVELYIYLKDRHHHAPPPHIPKFSDNFSQDVSQKSIASLSETKKKSIHIIIIPILLSMLTVLAVFLYVNHQKTTNDISVPAVETVQIKLYSTSWNEIPDGDVKDIHQGTPIFISVQTAKGINIDKARIRVNKTLWQPQDETTQFNPTYSVYYLEYNPATDEARLSIEAQLHSPEQGWLGN